MVTDICDMLKKKVTSDHKGKVLYLNIRRGKQYCIILLSACFKKYSFKYGQPSSNKFSFSHCTTWMVMWVSPHTHHETQLHLAVHTNILQ